MAFDTSHTVYAIYLQYGKDHFKNNFSFLKKTLSRIFPGQIIQYVVVENKFTHQLEMTVDSNTILISGNNQNREFSGYDEGRKWIEKNFSLQQNSIMVWANDTFNTHYGADYLKKFNPENVHRAMNQHALFGHIDHYPEKVHIEKYQFQKWVRSSFFITTYKSAAKIFPFALEEQIDEHLLFQRKVENFFTENNLLSSNYKQFLATWLFSEKATHSIFKQAWHSKEILSEKNIHHLTEKAKCIVAEHLLSAKAQYHNIPLIQGE